MSDAPSRPRRRPDLPVTVVLLVVGAVLAVLLGFAGVFVAFVSDPCTDRCDDARITAGVLVAMAAPAVAFLAGLVVSILLLVRRRLAFWVPLVAIAIGVLALFGGYALAASGVPAP